jgi:hypothetical protein
MIDERMARVGYTDLEYMEETSENRTKVIAAGLLRALQPAIPAVIGAAALTFLFAAVMPFSWVVGISWNLYLDRLSDLFVPPIGNGGRLALALGMAAVAAVIAGFVALLIARPDAAGLSSLRDRFRSAPAEADDGEPVLTRRRVDLHPDDPPRPPIRAGRDLPPGGLGAIGASVVETSRASDFYLGDTDELVLADLAPEEHFDGNEPWLQPAEISRPAMPDAADKSLGAMVARLEAGLARRHQAPNAHATTTTPIHDDVATEDEPEMDLALEAALSTLHRMTRQSVG